ncbi:aldo/keto reductase [Segetibacter sp. 3557_3]|uniref:aldo/keto reductase n=1 Tax=Segetibacter sp. 3557_3 TaxID=2547429 RepID=UPI0010591A74|nr:aldo/keto reductase [Segetibacter sp. 3557_3]TDH20662.1 aldo/keto reductase [Segetibacter sp. 3557_3]
MQNRKLGITGIEVPPITVGGNVFGWTVDEAASHRLLDEFVSNGLNFIDTANTYSSWVPGNKGGESETIIGNWMNQRGNRSQLVIATKVGSEMDGRKGLGKRYLLEMVDESLRRLQTDYIDLYQAHYPDPETPIEETLEAFDQLIKQGKVRAVGASNYSPEQLREAIAVSNRTGLVQYATLQPLYNLYDRLDFEKELGPICAENNVSVINYYALASGFLTGKYRSEDDLGKSKRGGGIKKYLDKRGLRILAALDEVAAYNETTPATIAIAWLLAKPVVTSAIASATTPEQIRDLVSATKVTLDAQALEFLDTASAEEEPAL